MKPPWFDPDGDHCQNSQFFECEKIFCQKLMTTLKKFDPKSTHESLSWPFVFLFFNFADCEGVLEKHTMAAQLVESLQIANLLATGSHDKRV